MALILVDGSDKVYRHARHCVIKREPLKIFLTLSIRDGNFRYFLIFYMTVALVTYSVIIIISHLIEWRIDDVSL